MPETFKQYLCEFCLTTSDIKPDGWHEENGWTQVADEEGSLDRCPTCTTAALADIQTQEGS